MLSMGISGCGGDSGPSSPEFNSGFEADRTIGSMSATERNQLCKSTQNYIFDQLGLETYCQYGAESNSTPSSGSGDESAFRAACTVAYGRCQTAGQAAYDQDRAQSIGSCDLTTGIGAATLGCDVSVALYEECAARRMDIYKSVAASSCENSFSADTAVPEDYLRDCTEPMAKPCSTP